MRLKVDVERASPTSKGFRTLWLGLTFSFLGYQFTQTAVPVIGAVTLDATPGEMGLLRAAGFLPDLLLVGFVAGALLDRFNRQVVLVSAQLLRAACLCAIPLLVTLGSLRIGILYVIQAVVGT